MSIEPTRRERGARRRAPYTAGMLSAPLHANTTQRRVLHFVTGGFSGATQVAVDLCRAAGQVDAADVLLVLRRKRNTDMRRVEALRAQGIQVEVVPGWAHLATIWALVRLCRQWRPDVLVAHGFPEHLLGRWAAKWAGVPAMVQVEHNSRERYTPWRRWQARQLEPLTACFIGVSEGVRQRLVEMGCPAERSLAIPNGIDLGRFATADGQDFAARQTRIVMSARFARQKDQLTLIRAVGLLRDQGLQVPLLLAGTGKTALRRVCEAEVARLSLGGQVTFLGHHADMPALLMDSMHYVLSTHWEGMPLALVEAMAAGCACIASDVSGVQGVIEHERTGLLVPESDPQALAEALARLLRDPVLSGRLAQAARAQALQAHGLPLMRERYEALFRAL